MNSFNKCFVVLLISGIISCETHNRPEPSSETPNQGQSSQTVVAGKKRKIKLAILLDTSSSMDGLIEQTKNQLWKIVTQLALTKEKDGSDPEIELALYQYGNDNLSIGTDYIEKVCSFTTELDELSEKLFALRTYGGSEYCGSVIQTCLRELEWSANPDDLQLIYIAGNEEFNQGNVNFKEACQLANEKNVIVNTIFCGDFEEGLQTYWKVGANLAKGTYFNIDQDAKIVHYDSPYDSEIANLNSKLNDTYIPYGQVGFEKKAKQVKEDANAESYGAANATTRYISKGSKVYKNSSWDLVDASDEKSFSISKIKKEELPAEAQQLSQKELKSYIEKKKTDRLVIKKEINELNTKREQFVADKRKKEIGNGKSQLEDVLIQSVSDQVKKKSFVVSTKIN